MDGPLSDVSTDDRIVIYRLGSIGDTIVALPCFHKIAERFPNAQRILLTNSNVSAVAAPAEAVLGASKLISWCIEYTASSRSASELMALRRRLRATRARTLIYLAESRGLLSAWRDLIFFKTCGFKRIIGIPLTPDLQKSRRNAGVLEPECERLARTLVGLGPIDLQDLKSWDLLLTRDELDVGGDIKRQFDGRPFVAIHLGGKALEKDWGEENWRLMLRKLARILGGSGLLLLGAFDDLERYRNLSSEWPGLVVNACGKLTPRQCAAALRHARLFIGHDSGPLHIASVSSVPCVGLFGSFNLPRVWHPHVGTRRIIHRVEGILYIGVDEVIEAVREMLKLEDPRSYESQQNMSGKPVANLN